MSTRKRKQDILWAPWRLAYVKAAGREKGCFICRALRGRNDKKNLLLMRGTLAAVILNRFPYNNGHLLLAPKRHVAAYEDVTPDEHLEMAGLIALCKKALENALNPQGFNVGLNLGRAAGAGLEEHLHYHIVPRWNGDTNFMPVTADAKVISQSLSAAYDVLRKELMKRADKSCL
jgi:ATP adenylyltransferase